jgi:fructose-specific PTS system IIC-like component
MGLATLIGRKYFTPEERETGKAALVMGCVGVSEGAIPSRPPTRCASSRRS